MIDGDEYGKQELTGLTWVIMMTVKSNMTMNHRPLEQIICQLKDLQKCTITEFLKGYLC